MPPHARRAPGARPRRDRGRSVAKFQRSPAEVQRRYDERPRPTYPDDLPIADKRGEIAKLIEAHQVVIVAGETGSGKTTQLPKICLDLGRGTAGLIGHTQPRRIAARTVAERIAEELDTEVGSTVGYAVRFTDKVGAGSYIKVMTDGILLAELQRDRMLGRYDTLIIDEAHERSLNIDFILGYLKQLLPKRPDLKLIITSATIDPESFSRHFDNAPVIEVSGRTYPVEIRYRPVIDPDDPQAEDRDQTQAVIDAVHELGREPYGDILVFLSGEREIRDTADALRRLELARTDVLPLYARLSSAEQHRIFARHQNRRIVLATNVAETSLTVPGIKYVIDAGTARISRYSVQTKVQRLPIEPISQASANQRAGRCGRTSDGICIRLYAEDDFDARPDFTDPEITRTNLASVILQMTAIGLGEIERFPFVQAPDNRNIADGIALLHELAAIEPDTKRRVSLTQVGRKLAALPIDPRLARMIVEAQKRSCLREVLVIAAAMSIQDPRERPVEAEDAAKAKHARFKDKKSDFMSYLNLWRYLREQQKELSSNQFRRLCKSEYINYLRVREWQDLVSQLKQVCSTVGIHLSSTDGDEEQVHRALLSGLLSHVGLQDTANKREYVGARNARFAIFPGSSVFKSSPTWIMAGELVDTSRLWARDVARIEPEWAEELAVHLVKRAYSEPHWERKRGSVVAYEKVTLYGVPIVARRKVNYGRIDPELSRELFIRQALVEGDWDTRHSFFHHNAAKIDEVAGLEDKSRRHDILVDDETLFTFYDSRIPADVVSGRHFDAWWKKARADDPTLLEATTNDLIRTGAEAPSAADFPDVWTDGRRPLELSYTFDPAAIARTTSDDSDGISVDIPVVALHEAYAEEFEWLVPGRREELIIALIRTLPKPVRRLVVPAPDRARQVLPRLSPGSEPLQPALARELRALTGAAIDESDFNATKLPDHLRMTFRIVDEKGRALASGKDLDKLKDQLAPKQRQEIASQAKAIERTGITAWDFGDLPATYEIHSGGITTTGFPALVRHDAALSLRVVTSAAQQREALRTAVRWLLQRELPSVASRVLRTLSSTERIALTQTSHPSAAALYDDCTAASIDLLVAKNGPLPMTQAAYEQLRGVAQGALVETVSKTMRDLAGTLTARAEAVLLLEEIRHASFADVRADVAAQLDFLFGTSFVTRHGAARLPDIGRYSKAIAVRLDRVKGHRDNDHRGMLVVQDVLNEYAELARAFPPDEPPPSTLTDIRWMIEELRVSTFAQSVPTAYTVSVKRIHKAMDSL